MPYYTLQYTGGKVITWKNFTDTSTPLSAANLQKSHTAINDIDQAVNAGFQAIDNAKLDKSVAGSMLTGIDYNSNTGTFVFHHYDTSIPDLTIDTNLEKIVVNFSYNQQTQKLELTQSDGTEVEVDLSAFVANPDLKNSDEISWTINSSGQIEAHINNGSITDEKLEPGFLADCTEQADNAAASADDADYYADLAKSYANGSSNLPDRPTENVDNSKYFKEQSENHSKTSEAWAKGTKGGTDVASTEPQYHNNAKYYAEQAASDGEAWARGTRNGTAVGSEDETYHNNAKYYAEQADSDGEAWTKGTRNGVAVDSEDETYHNNAKYWAGQAAGSTGAKDMRGATASEAGAHGLAPAPAAGDNTKFLRGDGSWGTPTDTTYSAFTGATSQAAGTEGLVTQPTAGDQDKFLTGGGSWTNDTANLITNYTTQDDSETTDIITPSGGETAISTLESGANHARLFNKISRCFLNVRKLINTVKRQWNVIGQTWATGEAVQVNWHRLYNGKWYRCILAHTTSSSILPTNTTYWKEVTIDSEISFLRKTLDNTKIIRVALEIRTNGDGRANITNVPLTKIINITSGGYIISGYRQNTNYPNDTVVFVKDVSNNSYVTNTTLSIYVFVYSGN
jgi:hypothetical protein